MAKIATSLLRIARAAFASTAITRTARLMVGLPDYESYLVHRRQAHPGEPAMTYEEFFRERQASRYGENGGKISRCC